MFPGLFKNNRYKKVLSKIIKDNTEYHSSYGKVDNAGSHSVKRGSAAFVCTVSTAGQYIIAVLFRSIWKFIEAK